LVRGWGIQGEGNRKCMGGRKRVRKGLADEKESAEQSPPGVHTRGHRNLGGENDK